MREKNKVQLGLIRLYIPSDKVRKFWMLYDLWVIAPQNADHWEAYRLWDFVGKCFEGGDFSTGWGIASDSIFRPYIFLMED